MVLLGILMVFWTFGRTTWNLYEVWPEAEEVQFVWQADFTAIATFLDDKTEASQVAIGGWTPETMDSPTMALLLKREALNLRYFDPTQALILPSTPSGESAYIARPAILPLAGELEQGLADWGLSSADYDGFVLYTLNGSIQSPPQFPQPVILGEQITFLGYDLVTPQTLFTPGPHSILTYWRVERPIDQPLRFFLHLVDEQGLPIVQQDTLGAPASYWHQGDIIIQLHHLDIPSNDDQSALLLGVYNPTTNERLTTQDGSDSIRLGAP